MKAFINTTDIIVEARLREIDENTVVRLMESISKEGQITPISINQDNILLAGAHRVEAMKRLDITEIKCTVIETSNDDDKLMIEIDENLIRNELHFLDVARQLQLKKDIYERKYPETVHGKNKGKSNQKSFVQNTISDRLSRNIINDLLPYSQFSDEDMSKMKELNLNKKQCKKLLKIDNVNKVLTKVLTSPKTLTEVLREDYIKKNGVKPEDMRPNIITPLKTAIETVEDTTSTIKKIDLMDNITIEYYYGKTKKRGLEIVKNNDMLQYHYFAQDYKVVAKASMICLITMTTNGLKEYIGFISLNSPTLDKTFRNKFFGNKFFDKMYKMYKNMKFLTMSRIVMLPSYRGLGITKKLQDKISDDLFSNSMPDFTDVVYIEVNSILLHNINFAGDKFNQTFINLKDTLSKEEYDMVFKGKNQVNAKGYKEGTTKVANTAFRYNEKYYFVLQEYIQKHYDIIVTENDKDVIFSEVNNVDFRGTKEPLMLLNLKIENSNELAS